MKFSIHQLLLIICFSLGILGSANAQQKGYELKFKLRNYQQPNLVLGYYFGEKPYIKDTVRLGNDGYFTFKADTSLEAGMYLVIMPPDNNYFQILLDDGEQRFSLETDALEPNRNATVTGSVQNKAFFDYINYLMNMGDQVNPLKYKRDSTAKTMSEKIAFQKQLDDLDKGVKAKQEATIKANPGTLLTKVILSSIEPETPDMKDITDSVKRNESRYRHYRNHYFDNMNIAEDVMLRIPTGFQRIDYYIEKMLPLHPDSIIVGIDDLLQRISPSRKMYEYYTIHCLNKYSAKNIVGLDAVYVHIAKNYICKTDRPSPVPDTTREKICKELLTLEPLLIGKVAPNIRTQFRDSTFTTLHDTKAKYTILYIWRFDCSHCKKSMPDLVKFEQDYRSKGVKIFAVGSIQPDELGENWKFIEEKQMQYFINTIDPHNISRYRSLYDVRATPKCYILDENKVIRSKAVGAEQLSEVLDAIIKEDNEKLKK